jgi:hypothetical protein
MHKQFVPHASEYLGTDIQEGPDVDFIADIHELSKIAGEESFDVIVSCSTFEHLKYPHLASLEILKTLKVGGALFVQTHQTFPLHSYPFDYFRFSTDALKSCFEEQNGACVVEANYEFPCTIDSSEIGKHGSWLNSCIFVKKTTTTPKTFQFKLDTK